jgi:hypothetical protein
MHWSVGFGSFAIGPVVVISVGREFLVGPLCGVRPR